MRLLPASFLVLLFLGACQSGPEGKTAGTSTSSNWPAGQTAPPQTGDKAGAHLTPAPALAVGEAKSQAHKLALEAVDLLDQGREDEAKGLLSQALALDPEEKIALSMQRQIASNPGATLGGKSFRYTVRSGESLSMIARRFMGDTYDFYILARYNDIRVPRDVHAGQVIRVPGEAPPELSKPPKPPVPLREPEVPPPSSPLPAQETSQGEIAYQRGLQLLKAGKKAQAYAAFQQAAKLDPGHAKARVQAEQLRQELSQLHSRLAMGAYYRQDMATAIKEWDKVLELDPGNESAALWRGKAAEVQKKAAQWPKQ